MARMINKNTLSPRENYEQKYRISRMNLLLVVIFTVVNLVLLVTNADSYFLFSAYIPYFIASFGMYLCGRFPDDYYTEDWVGTAFLDDSFFFTMLAIAIVLTLLYLLAWFMSGKHRSGWFIFALVLFGLDTALMFLLGGFSFESILDILFHAWVIYYLILGISAVAKLKKFPAEEAPNLSSEENIDEYGFDEKPDSPILRVADKDVKHRVLLEARVSDLAICYRRVKKTNELVINGNVYDEIEGLIEGPHALSAYVSGHNVEACYTGAYSIISVDGKNVAQKIRWY